MGEKGFMTNPLVLWIETFKPPDSKALEYRDLYDGVFLNDVMQQIDQRPAYGSVQRTVEDVSVRIINWDILVKNIRAYYLTEELLQQVLETHKRKFNRQMDSLKPLQLKAVCSIIDNDTVVMLPTGYGKSLIYEILPDVCQEIFGLSAFVLLIVPLNIIIDQEVKKLCGQALALTTENLKEICEKGSNLQTEFLSGKYSFVISHPENIVENMKFGSLFQHSFFKKARTFIVIDEAHCALEWGENFRPQYSKLFNLRVFLPDARVLAMSATLSKHSQNHLTQSLGLQNATVIMHPPAKENISIVVCPRPGTVEPAASIRPIIQPILWELLQKGDHFPLTIIYFCQASWMTCAYGMAKRFLGPTLYQGPPDIKYAKVVMYHASLDNSQEEVEVLQQLLIWKLPNIQAICREPEKDSSFGEVRKTLLLILGCAVQCEHKETVIENIKRLDIDVQHAIVEHIKEVTADDSEAVLAIDPADHNLEAYSEKMFGHITRLIQERDEQAEAVQELTQERDYYMAQAEGCPAPAPAPISPEKHHLAVELAEIKAKLRHTRQELEDKLEVVTDLRHELDYTQAELAKVKNENAELVQEARTTRSLRDELDILREEAGKVEAYEQEIVRYKERLNELGFYKARTEELREEVQILEETRTMLEEQLATSRRRVETVVELEAELLKYREQIENLHAERDLDRERIEMLTMENARLEFEKKSSMNESANLEKELEDARTKVGNIRGSLSDQLTETSNAKILRLELENQRLQAKLREMQEGQLIQSAEVNLQLEKENQRLSKRIEKLQEAAQETSQKLFSVEEEQSKAEAEKRELQQALDLVKENAERQVKELEEENLQLSHTIEVLRERNEKTNDAKMKDLERENKRMTETINAKNAQMSKMEFESRQLQRSYTKLKENVDRISELENENAGLEKENSDLHQKVATLQHTCDKLERVEQELSDMEVENRKLHKTVEALQAAVKKKEQLEQDHINLTVEKQKLERTLENLKGSSSKVAELESEKDLLNKELQSVRKLLESQKAQRAKQEQLEFDVIDLNNENARLQKTLEVTNKRLQQLEKDNSDMEGEMEQLQKQIESFKMSSRKLEDKEKETKELEKDLEKAQKDKATLEKENRKLKQALEVKESSLDDLTSKYRALETDHKAARKSMDQLQTRANRVKELEKENKEMFQNLNADRRTLATLREELVKEKIHSQELHNELENLHQELQRVGINTQKLALAEQSQDDNRLKALESLMQETLKKNTEIKEEKIQALEIRLEESKNRNLKLQEELREARRESETIKQRYEEEVASRSSQETASRRGTRQSVYHLQSAPPQNATKEILELKDHLVEVERKNATLLADNSNLQSNVSSLSEQCQKLESHISGLQTQNSNLQGQNSTLQSQNAQLQVENTTLQSKCTSMGSEKSDLQTQLSNLEGEHDVLLQRMESISGQKDSLARDHEALQDLHKQLSLEYEALISEHGSLKAIHKSLKNELKEVQEQLDAFLQGKDDVNKFRDQLEKERQQLKLEQRSLGNLQMDYNRLRDDQDRLRNAYDKLSEDYADSLASHKALKSELNTLQLKATEQSGELTEAKEQLTQAVMEVQKAENRLETMYQVNERLENENRTLLMELKQLLNQNQELLTQALNSKDHFAEEEKAYLEKLSELRRQKERLEEKIMEHYKNRMNSPKKNRGIGAMIASKARKIISRAPRRSKSRPDLTTLDNSSQGSGSQGDSMEQVNGSGRKRRGAKSTEDLSKDTDDELDGGFRMLSPTPKPVMRGRSGRISPGSEMLTLQQFLKEANSEAENNTPDESPSHAASNAQPDQHASHLSWMSRGSGSSSMDVSATSPPGAMLTSTPEKDVPYQLNRSESRSDSGSSDQPLAVSSPHYASQADMKISGPEPLRSPPPLPTTARPFNRELPPTPVERLDRLTLGTPGEQGSHNRLADPDRRSSMEPNRHSTMEPDRRSSMEAGGREREARHPLPRSRQQGQNDSNGPVLRRDTVSYGQSPVERPKSVPPQFFNPKPDSDGPYRGHGNREAPVPAPRYSRDGHDRDMGPGHDRGPSQPSMGRTPPTGSSSTGPPPPSSSRPPMHGAGPLPNRYSGPGGSPQLSSYNSPSSVPNHLSGPSHPPPHSHPGGPRQSDSPSGPLGQPHRRSMTPGPRYGSDQYGREPPPSESNPVYARPHSSVSRPSDQYSHDPPSSESNNVYARPHSLVPNHVSTSDYPPSHHHQGGPRQSDIPSGPPGQPHGHIPPHQYQGGPRQSDSPSGPPGQPHRRSMTPGPRYGSDQYSRDPPPSESNSIYARPQSSAGRPYPSNQPGPQSTQHRLSSGGNQPSPQSAQHRLSSGGNQPSPQSAQHRLSSGGNHPSPQSAQHRLSSGGNQPSPQSAQHRLSGGGSQPGPQYPSRSGPPPPMNRGDTNSVHHPSPYQAPHSGTPMARIPPQSKMSSAGRTDPPQQAQRTAVGDDQAGDRPKKNSVWYEYGCV